MELVIVRHADAGDRDPRKYPDDAMRPLSARGKRQIAGVARAMKRARMKIEVVIDSGYVRARQTSERLCKEYDIKASAIRTMRELEPESDPANTAAALRGVRGFERIAMIGHEPHLGKLIAYLVGGERSFDVELKKAGVCRISADRWTPGDATLLELIAPRSFGVTK